MSNTPIVFVGGSRHIRHLSTDVQTQLQKVVMEGASVIVGDANGADKALQAFFQVKNVAGVQVYCSGDSPRNNLNRWPTKTIVPAPNARGFEFYAAKDRQMAQDADRGVMIWDGKSPGTILNVLRLVQSGKECLLLDHRRQASRVFVRRSDWDQFLTEQSAAFRQSLQERAAPDEAGWLVKASDRQLALL